MDFTGRKVLVCGIAKSGIAAALLLKDLDAEVTVQDIKNENEADISPLKNKGIDLYLGKNPDEIVAGFDLIVLSPGVPSDLPFCQLARSNNIPIWSEVELAYSLSAGGLAAITGTNGKTTTTALSAEMIKSKYPNCVAVGNIGVPYSRVVRTLNSDDYIVAELSSFQLENVHSFHPNVCAVLNITPDHLNRHKTFENYIKVKEKIFENQNEDDFCILNYDDEICRNMSEKTKANVIFFSSHRELDKGIYLKDNQIFLKHGKYLGPVIDLGEIQMPGIHNYENSMAAIAVALCAGVALEHIINVLKQFKGVEHRIEYVRTIDGVDYYNDSKGTNPDASIKAIEAMVRPVVLIAGGYDKGSDFSGYVGAFDGKVSEVIVLGEAAGKIAETCKNKGFENISMAKTFKEAVDLSRGKAKAGECVLLSPACASWDMFGSFEQRGELFKTIVNDFEQR